MRNGFVLIAFFFIAHVDIGISNPDCSLDVGCRKCGVLGCVKCFDYLTYPGRKCVAACPYGYRSQWSSYADAMGRICVYRGSFLGLSNEALSVLTGVLSGAAVCALIILAAIAYVQHQRRRKQHHVLATAGEDTDDGVTMTTPTSSSSSAAASASSERKEFLKQLDTLRPYAHTLLEALNDARRQLRESHQRGDHAAIAGYRPIIRDLAKMLLLLNRPPERIHMPDDWQHLFTWAEATIVRCKRMSDQQPQVAQLINFLQMPVAEQREPRSGTTLSTFKPCDAPPAATCCGAKELHDHYDNGLNPQWRFDYNMISSTSHINSMLWKSSKESLRQHDPYFVDDDFYQLGYRPQDEITTEL